MTFQPSDKAIEKFQKLANGKGLRFMKNWLMKKLYSKEESSKILSDAIKETTQAQKYHQFGEAFFVYHLGQNFHQIGEEENEPLCQVLLLELNRGPYGV